MIEQMGLQAKPQIFQLFYKKVLTGMKYNDIMLVEVEEMTSDEREDMIHDEPAVQKQSD